MTARPETSAQRLLWLFPEWTRPVRGQEAIGLVLDQLPAGAARLPLRARADLIRAGLQARRTHTPGRKVRADVALASQFNSRGSVPVRWRPWLATKVSSRRFQFRCLARSRWPAMLYLSLFAIGRVGSDDPYIVATLAFLLVVAVPGMGLWALSGRPRWRAMICARNGLAADGNLREDVVARDAVGVPAVANLPVLAVLGCAAITSGPVVVLMMHPLYGLTYMQVTSAGRVVGWFTAVTLVILVVFVALRILRAVDRGPARATGLAAWGLAGVGGGFGGGVLGFYGVLFADVSGVGALSLLPCACLVTLVLLVAAAQRRLSRLLGLWDVVSELGPQARVQWLPQAELPPPPAARPLAQ